MIELTPKLDINSKKTLYEQLYEYIRQEIFNGNISAGEKLPSIRYLSKHLSISKNTVITAYEQLLAEGYVRSNNRSGIYVEMLDSELADEMKKSFLLINTNCLKENKIEYKYDLRNAQVDLKFFPYNNWRKLYNQCMNIKNYELLNYGEHQGEEGLRIQIARYLYLSRGVKCNANQILIGAGTQHTLGILSLILKNIANTIIFEEPGYIGAREVFKHHKFNIVPISLEHDGICLEKLNKSKESIVYITPSHQFPCGMVMPIAKRLRLLQWAQENNNYIIEDDYDGEFRYHGKPIPALQGLDTGGRVIYLGTFSKSLIPSIRISYMILPQKLLDIYNQLYKIYEQPVSRINQKCLQLFMEQGLWDKHIKKMRNIYKKKHDILLNSINTIMEDKVDIVGKDAGLHILLTVKNGMSESELIKTAAKNGVGISPTKTYWLEENKQEVTKKNTQRTFSSIFIGFGGIEVDKVEESIKLLKKSWF